MVADIKIAITNARTEYETKGARFDPVEWLERRITNRALAAEDTHRSRYDAMLVWDLISHPYIQDKEYREDVAFTILSSTAGRQDNIVTLRPEAVYLIDAMADAVGIPHTPGQRRFDLLPSPERKRQFREIYTKVALDIGI
jgi:hypothetical protein